MWGGKAGVLASWEVVEIAEDRVVCTVSSVGVIHSE